VWAPLALLCLAPPMTLALWVTCVELGGDTSALWRIVREHGLWAILPRPSLVGLAAILGWSALQLALLRGLPGRRCEGPPTPAGARPIYRDNGLLAWAVSHGLLVAALLTGALPATAIFERLGEIIATANVLALVLCVAMQIRARRWAATPDVVITGNPVFDVFQGIELHPRVLGVDLKQLVNCRVSMMGWSALAIGCLAWEHGTTGAISPGLTVSVVLVVVYLLKFFVWERGYFHSLDMMHDRFGFYLCWGVLVWVPAVYLSPTYFIAANPSAMGWPAAVATIVVGVAAIVVNYAADAQRQRVRAAGGRVLVFGRPPVLIRAAYRTGDGASCENLLLASGWWGIARHFHYLPELVVALALTLPAGPVPMAWVYPVFLGVLLVDRTHRDDERCRRKYGGAWEEYCRRVPWRIVPGLW